MIRNVLQDIGGIGIYGIISMVLFLLVFLGVLIWVLRLKRPYIDEMSNLPLDSNEHPSESGDPRHD